MTATSLRFAQLKQNRESRHLPVALDAIVVDAAGNERELTRTAVGSSVPSFAGNMTWTP